MGLFLTVVATFLLVACSGDSDETLDFRSVLHVETGTILSLGDEKAQFEEVLDEAAHHEILPSGKESYVFLPSGEEGGVEGDVVRVIFSDGVAITITMQHGSGFELKDISFDMGREEISNHFDESFSQFIRAYYPSGDIIPMDDLMEGSFDEGYYIVVITISSEDDRMTTVTLGRYIRD